VPSLFTDADRVAGLTAHADPAMRRLTLTFDDDELARAFAAANPAAAGT
jgi:hypothetical protein